MLPTRDEFKRRFGDQSDESLDILDAVRDLPARDCVLACVSAIDRVLQQLFPPDDSRRGIPDGMLQVIATLRTIEAHFLHNRDATFDDHSLPSLPLPGPPQRQLAEQDRFVMASILLHARLVGLIGET
jgi:hypothetical protein